MGGQKTFREAFWDQWASDSDVFFYVIDSGDKARYAEAMSELYRAVSLSKKKPLLYIIMNKLDLLEDVLVQVEDEETVKVGKEFITKKGDVLAVIDQTLTEKYLEDILWELNMGSDFSKHVQAIQFFGTSAKTSLGLKEMFEDLLNKVVTFQATPKEDLKSLKYVPPMESHFLKIQAIYVLTEGGLTLLSAELGSIRNDTMVVGGFLSALTQAAQSIFKSSVESSSFPLGEYMVYNKQYGGIRVFVVAERGAHRRALEKMADIAQETALELGVEASNQNYPSLKKGAREKFEEKMKEMINLPDE